MAAAAPRRSGAGRALRAERKEPFFCRVNLDVAEYPETNLTARINLIHRETLRVVEEELLVGASGQKLRQFRGFFGGNHEDMGFVRDAVCVVVNHVLVAIEGQAIVEIAADVVVGNDLVGRIYIWYFYDSVM